MKKELKQYDINNLYKVLRRYDVEKCLLLTIVVEYNDRKYKGEFL